MSKQANKKTATRLLIVAVAMFGFGYALVPLYDLLCDVTGLNGKTQRADVNETKNQKIISDRLVKVEFTTMVNTNLPWKFKALQNKVSVHPGEFTTVKFLVRNMTNEIITGQAIPSVAPSKAAKHFKKIECFCFTQQVLQPGEEKEMAVQFVVDSKLAPEIDTITLAYTFFNSNKNIKTGKANTGLIKRQPVSVVANNLK
ncbi:MAG: cytochrome c oxidase assembly protein [Acidiferrobacterales bacterium]